MGTGASAAEGMCILEGVLEAPLPLLLGGGLLGNGCVLSWALAGLAGSWEELPGSMVEVSTEFLCPGLGGKLWFWFS